MKNNTDWSDSMLRGVNRQIIEINSTDNCFFEKAILFVRPEFSEASETKLHDNANEFLNVIETEKQLVRNADNKKKINKLIDNKKLLLSFALTALIVAVSVGIILKVI